MNHSDIDMKTLRSGNSYNSSYFMLQKTYSLVSRINNKIKVDKKILTENQNYIDENNQLKENLNKLTQRHSRTSLIHYFMLFLSFLTNLILISQL